MSNKIGIITYHKTINYGAILQAYALSLFLEKMGHSIEFINYVPDKIKNKEMKYLYLSRYYLLHPHKIIQSINRVNLANSFIEKYLKVNSQKFSSIKELRSWDLDYNTLICGSDEIWNIARRELDESYFLGFINNSNMKDVKKISYAASFGETQFITSYKTALSELLRDFFAISVRDDNSLSLVRECLDEQENINIQINKVLDPTFLLEKDDYKKISIHPSLKNPYLLIYGVLNKEEAEYVKFISEKTKLDIISIGNHQKYLTSILKLNVFDVSPQQWLGFFENANLIMTKFYHGVIFSLIFNNPFIFMNTPSKSIKVKDLLSDLKLSNRILDFNGDKVTVENLQNIMYPPLVEELTQNILTEKIRYSQSFLQEVL